MKKINFFNSIRFKLIVVLLVTILIPLTILSKVNIYNEKNDYLNILKKDINNHISTLDNVFINYILSIEEDIEYLAEEISQKSILNDINNIKDSDIKEEMRTLSKNNSDLKHIYLALENGKIYLDNESILPKGYNPTERPFYIDTIKSDQKIVLSDIYMWEGERLLTLSKVVKHENKIIGVLGIDINIDKITENLESLDKSLQYKDTVIIDASNNVVCSTLGKNYMGMSLDSFIFEKIKYRNDLEILKINDLEKEYIFNIKPSNIKGWSIVGLTDYNHIKADLNTIDFKWSLVLLITIIIIIIILVFVSKNINAPIEYILRITKDIKNGNYEVHKLYNKPNEFGAIEDSLYTMTKEINLAHSTLENLAYKDLNLDINNKNKFLKEINKFCNSNKNNQTILLLDIRNFKLFNERFGYGKGDEFLIKISQFLLTIVDKENLFRYSGDEFAIILNKKDNQSIKEIEYKIHERFSKSWSISDINYTTGVVLIIMEKQENIEYNLDFILSNFEYTMKETKSKNLKTGYVLSQNSVLERKNTIKKILDTCISDKSLIIHYQPIKNIKVNEYKKMEALARLNDKELGMISPFEFISIAEETGQIYDIGLYILECACEKLINLDNKNIKLEQISINISAIQFMNENFVKDVIAIIEKYDIDSNRLIFEITESVFMESYEKILSIIKILSDKGIKFALDDFGTGFSSLSYVLNLPIDIIKIDKSFIQKIEKDDKSRDITNLIVSMCKKLNLEVIVEGVETREQLDILEKIECINMQGYYFSKPVSEDEIDSFLNINNQKY